MPCTEQVSYITKYLKPNPSLSFFKKFPILGLMGLSLYNII